MMLHASRAEYSGATAASNSLADSRIQEREWPMRERRILINADDVTHPMILRRRQVRALKYSPEDRLAVNAIRAVPDFTPSARHRSGIEKARSREGLSRTC